jgi:glycosyltransferase involved in cell wall biosynthesis
MSAVRAIAVVIPARDESRFIGRCVTSVLDSARHIDPGIEVSITIVADGCTDDTARVAGKFETTDVVVSPPVGVGAARRIGVGHALEQISYPSEEVWIANTDADSFVDEAWLSNNLRTAWRGSDLRIGAVAPDFRDLTTEQIEAWEARHANGAARGHVHGANLGVRASTYFAVGGFRTLELSEDVDFVERVIALGVQTEAADHPDVVTSGRKVGRAAGGYAAFLAEGLLDLGSSPVPTR